ncbi:winged helix-turn-helix domain-containing protein [Streptomyces sp. AV19]|uniref:AfsR/SARP family transcriptional regulator n=1 Tax=Streptomyces sp. AV19 TaxID=2793068 RepID=UPI0018FE5CC8|nr:AfsR/SARP family transcriptional regulator [Streptomyces sp. AV19]MBH1938111.1 winged helix-turn-helix domain-containing protein [Streptomyces sp. AV19]MDG4536132.1 winged helix-turn-helix domain-containing protein [Streptomyces sp. AV19]
MEAPRVRFKVLGPLEVVADGRPLPLGGSKQRTLLATLLVHANTPVPGERLCDAVWGENPPASAQANIRSYVAALRRVLNKAAGEDRLSMGHRGYELRVRPDEMDLHRFESLTERGRAALATGEHRAAAGHLGRALDLWRGDAFDRVAHHETLHIEAARLEESRLVAFESYAEARLALGEHLETVAMLQARTARHPLRESLWAKLMLAQYRCGRPGDALTSYTLARAALRDELGLEPGAELRRLHRAVLTRDPALGETPAPVAPARTGPAWRTVSQLPLDTPDFTGRHLVMSRAAALLEPAAGAGAAPSPTTTPVIVLTGPSGTGKTALATRLAHLLRHAFPDGQLFLRLDGARGTRRPPGALLSDLLLSLGVAGSSLPEATVDRAAMFRSLLCGRQVLLLLDDARDEEQIRPLLPGSSRSAVLVTSIARLDGLDGAHVIDVPPFDGEEAQALLRRLTDCRRLDAEPAAARRVLDACAGLPLALRLAGARLAAHPDLPLGDLADALEAERTEGDVVRAAAAAGYQGLGPDAAWAFRAIGLLPSPEFPGWILAALLDAPDTDRCADALLDAHLIQVAGIDAQGQPRYRMHDALHAYAAERAATEEPPAWRCAAVARVLDGWLLRLRTAGDRLVRGGPADLVRGGTVDPFGWLESERTNLVTAVEFAADSGYGAQAAALAAAMEDVCHLRNWWDEWERVARAARGRATADDDPVAAAVAQGSLARAAAARGRVDDAAVRFAAAIEQLDALGEEHHAALLRVHRSFAVADRGMAELAYRDAESAAAVLERLGDAHGHITALRSLGYALVCRQREAEAVEAGEAALAAAERLGHPLVLADVLQLLAVAEIGHGRFGRAARHLHRALAEYRLLRHRPGEAYTLLTMGRLHVGLGPDQAPRALGPLGEAAAVFTELGELRGEALAHYWLGRTHAALGDPARAAGHFTEALAGFRRLRMPVWMERARLELDAAQRAVGAVVGAS